MNSVPQQQTPTVAIDQATTGGDMIPSFDAKQQHEYQQQGQMSLADGSAPLFEPIASARTPTELDFQAAMDAAMRATPETLGHNHLQQQPTLHRSSSLNSQHPDHISPARRNSAGAQRVRSSSPKDMVSPYRRRVTSLAEPGRQHSHQPYRRRALSTPETPRNQYHLDQYRDMGSPAYSDCSITSPISSPQTQRSQTSTLQQSDTVDDDLSALFTVGLAPKVDRKENVPFRCRSLPSSFWNPSASSSMNGQQQMMPQQDQQGYMSDHTLGGYDYMSQQHNQHSDLMLPGGVRRDSRPFMSSPLRARSQSASVTMTTDLDTLTFLDSVARSSSPSMMKMEAAQADMHGMPSIPTTYQSPQMGVQGQQELDQIFGMGSQLGNELGLLGITPTGASPEHSLFDDMTMGFTTTV